MRRQIRLSKSYYKLIKAIYILLLLCFSGHAIFAQIRDPFTLRGPGGLQGDPNTCIFSLHGDFTMIANVNLWAASGADNQSRVNNGTNMVRIDLDGDATTSNSSMSELKLYSSCSKIVYAGLYWTARTSNSVTTAAKKTIKIKGPGAASYTTLNNPMYSLIPGDVNQYVCFTDVTQYVQDRGAGQYWVADMAFTEGSDSNIGNYAGWGMVVIYEDSELPMRNIAMFDGYAYVSGTQKFAIPVSGFKSVQTGPVKVKLGFMAGEGDAGYVGDWCQMRKATAAGNVNNDNDWIHLENPATGFTSQNFWRSRVTNDAGAVRNPNYTNNLGFDAFVFTADNSNNQFIGNNQTSTAIRYGTSQDQYVIFNMTMAVDAYEPEPVGINQVNTTGANYADQTTVAPGDIIKYKLDVTNQGNEAVLNSKIEIPVPYNASFVPGSIVATFDASLVGATASYDPAGQKIVINLGTLPVAPANNPDKVFASITYQLQATTNCYYLKNSNACLRNISLQGSITGTGAITGVAVNSKTISGYQGGACAQSPITTPTMATIVVPASYPACDNWQNTTVTLRICPGSATTIPTSTVRSLLTLPTGITYVFNSAANGSGTVYNDNNPFPAVNGTYYAVPINTLNPDCSGAIPFNIVILSVNTPPTTPYTNNSVSYCVADLPVSLVATPTSVDYSIFWYTQASGGNSVSGITIPANISPGTYTYYVAQGYDAGCQSARIPITVTIYPTITPPLFNGAIALCGGSENTYNIVSPIAGYTYEWVLDNAPVGVEFKNGISTGTIVTLTEATTASGTFTLKARAKNNTTGCYSDYWSLSISINSKPTAPLSFTGASEACEGTSTGNTYMVNNPVAGMNYEWAYSGTGYSWVNGSNIGQGVEIQLNTGATSGILSVRAKSSAGCYSDAISQSLTVNARPIEPASISASNICTGQNEIININNSGTLQYQVYSGTTPIGALTSGNGGVLPIDIGTFVAAGSFSYTVKDYNGKCYSAGATPVTFSVLDVPTTPILSSGVTTCYNTPPVITVLNAVPGITYNVYDNASLSGSPLNTVVASGSQLNITVNDNPTADKTYYVTDSNGVCSSSSSSVTVTVRDEIAAPVLSAFSICAGQQTTIVISNAPLTGGVFDNTVYQYKVYSDAAGNNEVALASNPEQVSSTKIAITPTLTITNNTTLYVRLVAHGCNGPLAPIDITIASRPAPIVMSPVEQCLGTNVQITIYSAVKDYNYQIYDNSYTRLYEYFSPQNGEIVIVVPSSSTWTDGTKFYVKETIFDENGGELCSSPYAEVVMTNGTPIAPSFTSSIAYTCSARIAALTIKNALKDYTYNIYDAEIGGSTVFSVTPDDNYTQYPINIPLPTNFASNGGTATYWMDVIENGSTCNSLRTPITITLATPADPILDINSQNITVCRGTIPIVTITNAKKDFIYTVYNNSDQVVTGPITASADGSLSIPLSGITLTGGQTLPLYLQVQAPAIQNSCSSGKVYFNLIDGEPVMPTISNITICHGEPISVTIPNPTAGYTYLIYDQGNNLVGTTNGVASVVLTDPGIPNPAYPNAYTDLNYYVKVQSATCTSESSTSFTVRVKRTAKVGEDFTATNATVCDGASAEIDIQILEGLLVNAGDLTLKWYINSDLTGLYHMQTYPAGTTSITQPFSNLVPGNYVYYLTVESAGAGICQNKSADVGIVLITVHPNANFEDLVAIDATICNGSSVTLSVQSANPLITDPIFNWYSDAALTTLVATNSATYTPSPNLTATQVYYITVHNSNYCENKPGNAETSTVTVNQIVSPPTVSVEGNATAICSGSDLVLNITPSGNVSGYELQENGVPVNLADYSVNLTNNTITIFAPSSGSHTYTVLSEFYSNNILCKSDALAPSATISVIVNNTVAAPTLSLAQPGVCQGENTVLNVGFVGIQPSDYILYSGTGVQDKSSYIVSSDMQTITLQQSVLGHHSYTLVALETANGITCQSQASAPVEGDLYPHPTVTISNTGQAELCINGQAELKLDFTGTAPFTYTVRAVDASSQSTYVVENATALQNSVTLYHNPASTTTYFVTALSDAHCSANGAELSSSVAINVYQPLNPGLLLTDEVIYNNTSPGEQNVVPAFNGRVGYYSYNWQQWNGSSFVDLVPAVTTATYNPGILTTGSYLYQRVVNDGCQIQTVQASITVLSDLQGGSLIANTTICNNTSPGELNVNVATGGDVDNYAYSWQQWDGNSFVNIVPAVTTATYNPGILTTGVYRYQRTITDGNQTIAVETTITVLSNLLPGSLIADASVCLSIPVGDLNLSLPTGGNTNSYTYSWQVWDGNSFVNIVPEVTSSSYTPGVLAVGMHRYQRTVTDGCQTATSSVAISVYSDLQPGALIANQSICNNTSPGNLNLQPADVCDSPSGISYLWYSSSDGITWTIIQGENTVDYTPNNLSTGMYYYKREANDGTNTTSVTTQITVFDDLQGGSLLPRATICNNTSPGDLSASLGAGGNSNNYVYTWQLWDGSSFVDIVPAVTTATYNPGVLSTGVYRFQRTITDGCETRTAETTITVLSDLQGGSLIANTSVCINTSIGNLNLTLPTGGKTNNYSYSWQLWSGDSFGDIVPAVTTEDYNPGVLPVGTYEYQRTVTDGCQTAMASVRVGVYSDLQPGALISNKTICNNTSPGNLNVQSADVCNGSLGISYLWYSSPDGSTWTIISGAVNVDYDPGNLIGENTYYYKREASDGANSASVITRIDVVADLQGGSLIPSATICNNTSPGNLSLSEATEGNLVNYAYRWQLWNGSSFVDIVPAVTTATYNPGALTAGVYRYQRTITDGCQTRTVETTITVLSNLQGGSLIADASVCVNALVGNLNLSLPTGGNTDNYTYSWQLWDGSNFVNIIPAVTTEDYNPGLLPLGTYQYQRTVTDGCQTATASVRVGVYSDLQPGALISNKTICNNTSPGNLNLQPAALCNGTSSISYKWYTSSDGSIWAIIQGATSVDYVPNSLITGTHYYKRDATYGTSTLSAITEITVLSDLQGGSLIPNTTICNNTSPGELSAVLATGGNTDNYTYSWQLWNGSSFVDIVPAVTTATYNPGVLTAGVYRYQRTITDGCQTLTAETTVTVASDLHGGSLITNKTVCISSPIGNLNASLPTGGKTDNYSYKWQLWGGVSFIDISPGVMTADYSPGVLLEGTYLYQRTVTDGCQTAKATATIVVYNDLHPGALIANATVCNNTSPGNLSLQPAAVCSSTSGISYEWYSSTDGITWTLISTATAVDYNPGNLTAGVYYYKRSATDGLNTVSTSTEINVFSDLQGGSLIAPVSINQGTSPGNLSLSLPTGGNVDKYIYSWQLWDETAFVNISPAVNTATYNPGNLQSGTYRYQRTITDGCQTRTAETTITVSGDLDAGKLVNPLSVCNNTSPGNLSEQPSSSEDCTYSWERYDGTAFVAIPGANSADYNPGNLSSGVYRYRRVVTNGFATKSVETNVTVFASPEINVTNTIPAGKVHLGTSISFIVTPNNYREYQFIYSGKNIVSANNTFELYNWIPEKENTIVISVTDENGCTNTIHYTFTGPPFDLPNIITPNNDGYNDLLLKGFNIEVFNRWGSRLYQGTDGWNGKYNGQYVAMGTYYYVVHLTFPDGTTKDIKYYVMVKR